MLQNWPGREQAAALDVDEGHRGLCPGFSARFPTPRRVAKELAQLGSGIRREKLFPCPSWLLSPKKLHLRLGEIGNPQQREGTSHGGGRRKKTKTWGEDPSREEGGTVSSNWMELESRR